MVENSSMYAFEWCPYPGSFSAQLILATYCQLAYEAAIKWQAFCLDRARSDYVHGITCHYFVDFVI